MNGRFFLVAGYLFIICIAIAGFLSSCENKTVDYGLDAYYVEIVTAQVKNEFLTDNGKIIIATPNEKTTTYTSGDRVLLNYTLLSDNDNNVRINGSAKVPMGKLTFTSNSAISKAVKEPILLESVWIGSHYLNMQFYLDYKSVTHTIGLLADSTRLDSDTLRLYFIHDANNDPPGYPNHTYLSFDLEKILNISGKNRPVSIQINTSNYGDKVFDLSKFD
jgi:hypothetical protein